MSEVLRITAAFALVAVYTTACTLAAAPIRGEVPPRQPAPAVWRITFALSGGFSGFDRTLQIASTGETSAADRKRRVRYSAKATNAELAQLNSVVGNLKPIRSSRQHNACRDCLEYNLDIHRNGEQFLVRLDDTNLSGSGFEPLVQIITTLLNRVLAQNYEQRR